MSEKYLIAATTVTALVVLAAFNNYVPFLAPKHTVTAKTVQIRTPMTPDRTVSQEPTITSRKPLPETLFVPMPTVAHRKAGQPKPALLI